MTKVGEGIDIVKRVLIIKSIMGAVFPSLGSRGTIARVARIFEEEDGERRGGEGGRGEGGVKYEFKTELRQKQYDKIH